MNVDKKNQNNNPEVEKNDEIDSFAKALLNKKTHMALFPEDEDITSESLDMSQRRAAEETMSSALDLLRKERGQVSIEEEEEAYVYDQNKDLFDTSKLNTGSNVSFESIFDSMDEEIAKKQKAEEASEEESDEEEKDQESNKTKPVSTKEIQKKKQKNILILIVVIFIGVLLAGYTYKVAVYDPAHVVTEQQKQTYDKLMEYADEWDMLSDAEKLEIIDLEKDYDDLVDSQKQSINEYFVEQTEHKFTTLLSQMKKLSKDQKDETKPEYVAIMNYMTGWSDKSTVEQHQILNYQNQYNQLSKYLKAKINDKCVEETGLTFISLCKDQKEIVDAEREQQKKDLRAQIDDLKRQLNDLNVYQQDLEAQKENGEEVDEEITMNRQTIQSVEAQIQQLENQLAYLEQ